MRSYKQTFFIFALICYIVAAFSFTNLITVPINFVALGLAFHVTAHLSK